MLLRLTSMAVWSEEEATLTDNTKATADVSVTSTTALGIATTPAKTSTSHFPKGATAKDAVAKSTNIQAEKTPDAAAKARIGPLEKRASIEVVIMVTTQIVKQVAIATHFTMLDMVRVSWEINVVLTVAKSALMMGEATAHPQRGEDTRSIRPELLSPGNADFNLVQGMH